MTVHDEVDIINSVQLYRWEAFASVQRALPALAQCVGARPERTVKIGIACDATHDFAQLHLLEASVGTASQL
jgi:hypothetical protein